MQEYLKLCLPSEDIMISDRLVHASIIDGMRLCSAEHDTFKHSNMEHLEQKLQLHQNKRIKMVITDGVFSMDGDLAKLDEMADLCEKYDALLFVDDSHASGFIGKTGRGTHEYCNVMGRIDIITTTFGKGLGGASGGCVSGRKEIVEMCRQKARPYLFSNTIAPVVVSGVLEVFNILQGVLKEEISLKKTLNSGEKDYAMQVLLLKREIALLYLLCCLMRSFRRTSHAICLRMEYMQ